MNRRYQARRKRSHRKRDVEELATRLRCAVEIGYHLPGTTGSESKEAWNTHRAALLREWIGECPRSRPWAWWRFDAPEHRRLLSGTLPDGAEGEADQWYNGVYTIATHPPLIWESEADFLERHHLLTAEEKKTLAPTPARR